VLVNPASGRGKAAEVLEECRPLLQVPDGGEPHTTAAALGTSHWWRVASACACAGAGEGEGGHWGGIGESGEPSPFPAVALPNPQLPSRRLALG
jgi:hypothetical protein